MESKSRFDQCMDALGTCFTVVRRTKSHQKVQTLIHDVYEVEVKEIYEVLGRDLTYMEATRYAGNVLRSIDRGFPEVKVYIAHKDNMYCAVNENNEPIYI